MASGTGSWDYVSHRRLSDFIEVSRGHQGGGVDKLMKEYFDHDELNRFEFEKVVGKGAQGIAWRLIYRPRNKPGEPQLTAYRIVLKVDRLRAEGTVGPGGSGSIELENEISFLTAFQWAAHIVKIVVPHSDPLGQTFNDVWPHGIYRGEWLYLEWLENGSVKQFIERAHAADRQLPNRMLWRFFMCLIRVVIAMAWPPSRGDTEGRQILETIGPRPGRKIEHRDMHDENVMFGPLIIDGSGEHDWTPIIKAIDFGFATEYAVGSEPDFRGPPENIFAIGALMASLATLNRQAASGIWPRDPNAAMVKLPHRSEPVKVAGTFLIPDEGPNKTLDPLLRNLILACTATDPGDRPSIAYLQGVVSDGINVRDERWYRHRNMNDRDESYQNIQRTIQDFIFNA
ncbi:hypothetical protein F5Y11DRAFT_344683 [Daldinia sp. FL1419]|nr:hypothetical protein F5Y11DRAFT_344683 [Daldinia sp. FL1419]